MNATATLVAGRCRELFAATDGAEVMGLELELLPIDAVTGRRCPIIAADAGVEDAAPPTLPILRRAAALAGWCERPSPYGAPVFVTPDGATISYEPGGQIEYSAAPQRGIAALIAPLEATVEMLRLTARQAGVELLTVGIDPYNSISAVPLQLHGDRYVLMDRYFSTRGPAGARMMRQTAACQITLDAGSHPAERWRLLSALAPYVTAAFANSPCYAGATTGYVSTRADAWRHLDPARTGLPGATAADPATAYEIFALAAPAILRTSSDGAYRPFGDLLARGDASEADWGPHLTTLFPEVRPRRIGPVATFELRSADAVPIESCVALCVFVAGLVYDRTAGEEAMALLGPAHPGLLERATRLGLRDPAMAYTAAQLFLLALEGAARLGDDVAGGLERARAEEYARRYTLAARFPGSDACADLPRERQLHSRAIGETHAAATP
jgi:glutamate--cysteine ligase